MNGKSIGSTVAAVIMSIAVAPPGIAHAAEITVLSVGALRSSLAVLVPEFEKSSGHKVKVDSGAAGAMVTRIQRAEAVDVAIVTTAQVEMLAAQGKIASGTQVNVARVGMGVGATKGAAKADIGSMELFKSTLLAANSIGHTDPASGASSAIYTAQLLERLDIAAQIRPKIRIFPSNVKQYEALAKGDVELGFGQITELVAEPGIVFVGPLPAAIQNYSRYSAGIVANARELDAAKAFLDFLTSPAAAAVMNTNGVGAP
jgi:molybdate transport system substrate-binding protein